MRKLGEKLSWLNLTLKKGHYIANLMGCGYIDPCGIVVRTNTVKTFALTLVGSGLRGGKGAIVLCRYADGRSYLPTDACVKARKPIEAMR
jgi:hypothetical protein